MRKLTIRQRNIDIMKIACIDERFSMALGTIQCENCHDWTNMRLISGVSCTACFGQKLKDFRSFDRYFLSDAMIY